MKNWDSRISLMQPIQSSELTILYRDEYFVAVDKPSGMIVHRSSKDVGTELVLLQTLREQIGSVVYPVHRLDQPTSGAILFGLSPSSAAAMVEQFTQRQVAKYYQAFVRGWMHRNGSLRMPLAIENRDHSRSRDKIEIRLQKTETDYSTIRWYEVPECLETGESSRFSLVEANPKTGRWHQIRRHLKHIAHPIIGDYRHGDDRYNDWIKKHYACDRLLLASCYIEFRHPFSNQLTTIRAGRGESFDVLLSKLTKFEVPIQPARLPQQPYSQQVDNDSNDE